MSDDSERRRKKRARDRKAMREHVQKHGQHRDRPPAATGRERELLTQAQGIDGWEKASWLKAQKAALELAEKMELLISRPFVAQRLAEIGRLLKDAVLKVPARLAHEMASERSAEKCRAKMEEELTAALSALANMLDLPTEKPAVQAEAPTPKPKPRKGHRGPRRSRPLTIQ